MPDLISEKVTTLVLDASWRMGVCEIDGARLCFLAFEHPTHGLLHFHLSHETVAGLPRALDEIRKALGAPSR